MIQQRSSRYGIAATAVAIALLLTATDPRAEVVVVVSSKSPVGNLTRQQVADIFLGKVKNFPGGEQAITSILASGGPREEFLDKVLNKSDAQARATWSRLTFTGTGVGPKELKDATESRQLVANNPNVIGILDKPSVDSSVKIVFTP